MTFKTLFSNQKRSVILCVNWTKLDCKFHVLLPEKESLDCIFAFLWNNKFLRCQINNLLTHTFTHSNKHTPTSSTKSCTSNGIKPFGSNMQFNMHELTWIVDDILPNKNSPNVVSEEKWRKTSRKIIYTAHLFIWLKDTFSTHSFHSACENVFFPFVVFFSYPEKPKTKINIHKNGSS